MPAPSTRPLSSSTSSFVTPSVRSSVSERPDAAQGNRADLNAIFPACAWVSVRPHQAISGSVKTTAGMARGSKTVFLPRMASTATRPSCVALWASMGSPATSPMAKMDGPAVRRWASTFTKPFGSSWIPVLSSPSPCEFGFRPTDTSTRSKTSSGGSPGPSKRTRMPLASSFIAATFVFNRIPANDFSIRLANGVTRSRSAPGRSPGIISTTVTFEPSAA